MVSETERKQKLAILYHRWQQLAEAISTTGNVLNIPLPLNVGQASLYNVELYNAETVKLLDDLERLIEDTRNEITK